MKPQSKCCQATMTVFTGSEGTNHWICARCGQPCDPVERVERQTGQTMTELNERVVNYFRTYKGMYSQADVEKLLATARAEGAQEERNKTRRAYCEVCRVFINVDTGERIDHAK